MDSNRSHGFNVPGHPHRAVRLRRRLTQGATLLAVAAMTTGVALAQVPPRIEAQLHKIGRIVDPPCTALLYRPMMPRNDIANDHSETLYPGMRVIRNQSFGPSPLDVVDIFTGDHGAASRTVLIFVPGGAGNKTEIQNKAANAFYDNIGRWAVQHGMVGVLMQRRPRPKSWNGGARDISSMLQWVEAHIGQYHGNPDRMFIWAHSAGNYPLGTYAGRPELWGPKGIGVRGIIFMSPAAFDIAPVRVPRPRNVNAAAARNMLMGSGKACGLPAGAAFASAGALPGVAPGHPGGPPLNPPRFGRPAAGGRAARRGGPGFGPRVSPAVELSRSSLPALEKSPARIMFAYAELDPPGMGSFVQAVHDALCKAGHCPMLVMNQGESHMSEMFSVDTPDHTVSDAVLRFIRSTH